MENIKLEMNFKDENGKNFKISVDDPKDDLKKDEIKGVCDLILSEDTFKNKGSSLNKLVDVNKITTITEKVVF